MVMALLFLCSWSVVSKSRMSTFSSLLWLPFLLTGGLSSFGICSQREPESLFSQPIREQVSDPSILSQSDGRCQLEAKLPRSLCYVIQYSKTTTSNTQSQNICQIFWSNNSTIYHIFLSRLLCNTNHIIEFTLNKMGYNVTFLYIFLFIFIFQNQCLVPLS